MDQRLNLPTSDVVHPPLASLEVVRAVARHQSLTAAAIELGLTAGALSRRVAALEAWLGTPLFERHGRGMRPTPDGQRFLSRIEDAFALIAAAADPWRGQRGSDVVRISVVPAFARMWLLLRLRRLELGPDGGQALRVDVAVDYRHADVEGGEVDVAVRYGRGTWKGVVSEPLMEESLVPVAHADLAARLGTDVAPTDLLQQTLLCDSDAVAWREWLRAHAVERFRPRPHDRRFEDYGLVLAAAQAGLGVALARVPFADAAVEEALLTRLSCVAVPSPLTYHLVTRQRESRPAVVELCQRLKALAKEDGSIRSNAPRSDSVQR
ncbi:LysR family transcriptional regulator [Rhizobium deserti]|uniref:LysR family transcriptional regulator n=2 Tax=Rhizobium deserti TaxID=2547961 RepID=A0A4V3AN41_9HYPH|nr:LysR family transcriptional regulator [Rhizobium deserti]